MKSRSDMDVFVTVVDEGSFAGAANHLRMTPSGVSRRITGLEERLGVRLLNRTTRRLSLTEPGEIYFQRSSRILADIEETERETTQLYAAPRGRLRVTAPNGFGNQDFVNAISEFMRQYPQISIDLTLTERLLDIVAEGFDVAFRSGPQDDSSLIVRRIAASRRVICASPDYLEQHGVPETLDDLANHNCLIHHIQQTRMNEWQFDIEGTRRSVSVDGSFNANSAQGLYRAALSGIGIVRASNFVVGDAIRTGRLVEILHQYSTTADFPVFALYPSNRHLSPKIRAFIDFMTEHFSRD